MSNQCRNCGSAVASKYCPNCGQDTHVGRLTIHSLTHEAWHGFTHTDKGILKLWVDLLMRPRQAYRNYFNGQRKSYFSPVVFFLLSYGLFIYFDHMVFDYQDHVVFQRTGHTYNNEIGRYIQDKAKYIGLVLLPFQALLMYLFFPKKINFAESIVFWLFCVGFVNTILVLMTPIRLLLIDHKSGTEFMLRLLSLAIFLVHVILLCGTRFVDILKSIALVFLIALLNTYIGFFFLRRFVSLPYPTLKQGVMITFLDKSVMYRDGKTTIE